ncbi:tRNA lysidine(34) synthetase TilS [Sphingomonas sp. AP4-R1]|uniref:tRNA lysidine(34) synthetase TilS n=1 Tax=Sphingomonas sp. AP4-R1 TaxID=2735134 RepID=UPI001493C612|nr:tRNA lysidine(34) synthetase TilS [Sphingomonas sp. AP4-R1]QJU59549.1 tRNA lysidine(34) synthetase TilS [Sphingomonas sp. AP4-R1]
MTDAAAVTITPPDPDQVARFARDVAPFVPPQLAGEGDHAKHGGGENPDRSAMPLHQPSAGPPPHAMHGEDLAVAVSGGPDSLALLLLASAALPGRVAAVTVDHGLRPEAAGEARFAADLCTVLSVPHATLRVTVADDPAGIQAAARRERYAAMAQWAHARGIAALATAHHLDDQAETVMMRLERGAGVAGLSGIRPDRALADGVRLIRPLLGWRRSELGTIVRAAGLSAIDDPSNRDPRFDRAAVRARLAEGWPDPTRLAAVASHMAQAEDALAFTADRLFAERYESDSATLAAADLPRELRRRLLIAALARLAPHAILRGDEVDRLLDRLAENRVSTLAGLRIQPGRTWRFTPAPPHRSA